MVKYEAELESQAEIMVSNNNCTCHSEIAALEYFLFSFRAKADDLCQGLVNHSLTPLIKSIVYSWLAIHKLEENIPQTKSTAVILFVVATVG